VNDSRLASLIQRYFTDRLLTQVGASPHTVAAYRDAFRMLLKFAATALGRQPSELRLEELDAAFLGRFLDHLESGRTNSIRTRNHRPAALRAFFRYVALAEPAFLLQAQRILAIPSKRYEKRPVEFLTEEESAAVIAAPDANTWIGRRDRALLLLAVQTGLRNSELTALKRKDVHTGTGAHVRCLGKGRKQRCTPLRQDVAAVLQQWLSQQPGAADDPLFPGSRGGTLSADAVQRLVSRHVQAARRGCPSLAAKRVTPHTLRHAAAMALLHCGVDLSVIALWLGHASTETTQIYLHADMQLKERALAHSTPSGLAPDRFRPEDPLLAFLESL